MVEYGLDSLERRYYHPSFRFDFPFQGGGWFSEVQYISRMNGRLQGAIDYWVNAGVQKAFGDKLRLELRLNHFCRHETLRDTLYVWSINEVLARVGLAGKNFDLALAAGPYIGSSPGYRELLVLNGEWRGVLFPELSLFAELKLVNFARLYYEGGFYLALNRNVDIFFKNTRHYEFPNTSYLGLRYRSDDGDGALLDTMKMLVGVSPFDTRFKLEVEGEFKLDFFRNESRRVVLGIDFETPVLNGDSFFAQFWPARMNYDIGLDYEKKLTPRLFAAWVARYRLALPVDKDRPFTASLFTGLALRNQPDFDELGRDVRYRGRGGLQFQARPGVRRQVGPGDLGERFPAPGRRDEDPGRRQEDAPRSPAAGQRRRPGRAPPLRRLEKGHPASIRRGRAGEIPFRPGLLQEVLGQFLSVGAPLAGALN